MRPLEQRPQAPPVLRDTSSSGLSISNFTAKGQGLDSLPLLQAHWFPELVQSPCCPAAARIPVGRSNLAAPAPRSVPAQRPCEPRLRLASPCPSRGRHTAHPRPPGRGAPTWCGEGAGAVRGAAAEPGPAGRRWGLGAGRGAAPGLTRQKNVRRRAGAEPWQPGLIWPRPTGREVGCSRVNPPVCEGLPHGGLGEVSGASWGAWTARARGSVWAGPSSLARPPDLRGGLQPSDPTPTIPPEPAPRPIPRGELLSTRPSTAFFHSQRRALPEWICCTYRFLLGVGVGAAQGPWAKSLAKCPHLQKGSVVVRISGQEDPWRPWGTSESWDRGTPGASLPVGLHPQIPLLLA